MIVPTAFADDNATEIVGDVSNGDVLTSDYYFDANIENDSGNGSANNPYRDFKSSRISSNSNIYLANGNYTLDKYTYINNVTIIGSNPSQTIIKYSGTGFSLSGSLSLKNLTLINLGITMPKGSLDATNVIFKDSKNVGSRNSATWGGAIYCQNSGSSINLDNCIFNNTYADHGGAICVKEAALNICNCLFTNTYANLVGGSIIAENSIIYINKSSFINTFSVNDSGGAVHLINCNLYGRDLEIINSTADFGGAIVSLKSIVEINNLTAKNNRAKYYGGAIYATMRSFSITNSLFDSNSALNGGAIYASCIEDFIISSNKFINNVATDTAGGVYSIKNEVYYDSILDKALKNTFKNNKAPVGNNVYEINSPDFIYENYQYQIIRYNASYNATLPSRYDLRDLNQVTSVKDQKKDGTCWAFAAVGALESALLKATGKSYDLSEANMKNLMTEFSIYGWPVGTNVGAQDNAGYAYLVNWLGMVNESEDYYRYDNYLSPVLNSFIHVQNILFLTRSNYTDNDEIKRAIMDYGGVATSMYMVGNNQFYNGSNSANHAVVIVGWDDDKVISGAPGNGAWIVKNSWGSNWGENGYFYVSYYDKVCAKPGSESSYAVVLNDTIIYDKNYQYDIQGRTDYYLNESSTVWYKNRFTATDNEYLAAVSTYFEKETSWQLSVYVNNVLKLTQKGVSSPSYKTIDLNKLISLSKGDVFEILFKITVDGDAGVPISEAISFSQSFFTENMSFISFDGKTWYDLMYKEGSYSSHTYYGDQCASIKAFTILNKLIPSVAINVLDDSTLSQIEAVVMDQYGNPVKSGKVTFTLDGESVSANVANGVARINYNFNTSGIKTISAKFSATGYKTVSSSISQKIYPAKLTMSVSVSKNIVNATITVKLSKNVNLSVYLDISDVGVKEVKTKNGVGNLTLNDLYYGKYTVKAYILSDIYSSKNVTKSFSIDYLNTFIKCDDLKFDYAKNYAYSAIVVDKLDNPISGKKVTVTLNGKTYSLKTDKNGAVSFNATLPYGSYVMKISCPAQGKYLSSVKNVNVNINPNFVISLSVNKNVLNATVNVKLSKSVNAVVYLDVNGSISKVSVKKGSGTLSLNNLYYGKYTVKAYVPDDSVSCKNASASFTIDYIATYIKSQNLAIYYGDKFNYSVTLVDQLGNPIANKKVVFTIDKKQYTSKTNAKGVAYLDSELSIGNYSVKIQSPKEGKYLKSDGNASIKIQSTIVLPSSSKFTYTAKYVATLTNSKGQPLANRAVAIFVDGKRTVLRADNTGKIYYQFGTSTATYEISVVNPQSNEIRTHKVSVVSRIYEVSDMSMYWGEGKEFKVRVLDDYGNFAKGVRVAFNMIGSAFFRTTDSDGYASVKINLPPNSYLVTTIYNGARSYNTITVKKTIITTDVAAKKGNTIVFRAKILDTNGVTVKNQIVTFTFKGINYFVKTESNGFASLYLQNNYAVGKYTMITSYNGYRVANTVTVR